MKKSAIKLISVALAATMVAPALSACGSGDKGDPNTLYIVCLDKGYGRAWIDTLAAEFTEQTGFKVDVTASASAASLINSHLSSKDNKDDLYISVGNNWKTKAAQGAFANLDSLLDETVDGETVKAKVMPEYSDSLYLPDRNGNLHTYRLPWTAGVGGIYYNTVMFEENGWTVPTTYSELITLCETIKDDAVRVNGASSVTYVKPFIYTSANTDYFDYPVFTWWGQLAGKSAISEFTKYASKDNFDTTKNATYAKLKDAVEMWDGIFGDSSNYIADDNNHTAQTRFANGYAAMMINGDWLYNEILGYQIANLTDTFKLGYMKTPAATGAVETDITYTVGEDQYIAIPQSSSKKDKAKEFIKLMVSDHGCEVFANQAHGLLAYSGSLDASTTDEFMQNLIDVKASYSTAFTSFPPVTEINNPQSNTCMLALTGLVDIWGSSAARPFERMLGGTTLDNAFKTVKENVEANWESWKRQAGL